MLWCYFCCSFFKGAVEAGSINSESTDKSVRRNAKNDGTSGGNKGKIEGAIDDGGSGVRLDGGIHRMWLSKRTKNELDHWLRRTDVPMLASMPDGEILWCNRAFEVLTGYTISELERMSWRELTDDAEDRNADIDMAHAVEHGERESYQLQKRYRTKNGPSVRVMIHVLRNPIQGEFSCFFVSVIPLDTGYEMALAEMQQVRQMLAELLVDMNNRPNAWNQYWSWVKKNKVAGAISTVVIAVFILGDRLMEIIKEALVMFNVFPGP